MQTIEDTSSDVQRIREVILQNHGRDTTAASVNCNRFGSRQQVVMWGELQLIGAQWSSIAASGWNMITCSRGWILDLDKKIQCDVNSVSNRSGLPASSPGTDQKDGSVRVQNRPKTRPAVSWRAKPGPVPVNLRVLPGLAKPVGSNLRFCVSGISFMVAFRYPTVNSKILTFAHH